MFPFTSIKQFQNHLKEGNITSVQVVESYLLRIKKYEHLNAFVEVFSEEALIKAAALDKKIKKGEPIGKLHGVVIGIKDVISYKDHPLTAASGILKARQADPPGQGFKSVYSSTVVERLLAEDAIIIGTLNCDEFAMGSTSENSVYGKVLNPLDETRVPGGSSGGSAAAISAGLCMTTLGSDTGGSVRQPADFCGIAGLKPSYGRISRHGLVAYASSFDQIGIFANNIPDIALMLEVIAGADEFDSTISQKEVESYSLLLNDNKKYAVAYFPEALDHPSLDPEIAEAIKKKIEQLKSDGHEVKPVKFDLIDYIVPAYYILTSAEASSNLSRYDGVRFGYRTKTTNVELTEFYKQTRSAGFSTEVKRRIMLGTFVLSSGYYDAYFTRAQKVRKKVFDKIQLIFNDFDFILLPTAPSTAFKIGEKTKDPLAMYLSDIYTVLANLAGIPAISIPLFKHSNKLPFGLQLMAKKFNELPLLRFSHQLMQQINAEL